MPWLALLSLTYQAWTQAGQTGQPGHSSQLTDPPIITAVLSKYKYTVLTNNFPQKSDMDNQLLPASPTYTIKQQVETFQLLPASPTYTIKQQVETLWIQGIKLKHILQNAEIFVYLLNALIPLLKEPKRFSKLLNKVKRQQKVTL